MRNAEERTVMVMERVRALERQRKIRKPAFLQAFQMESRVQITPSPFLSKPRNTVNYGFRGFSFLVSQGESPKRYYINRSRLVIKCGQKQERLIPIRKETYDEEKHPDSHIRRIDTFCCDISYEYHCGQLGGIRHSLVY